MTCPACERQGLMLSPSHVIASIGMVCPECFSRLNSPTIYEGCVTGESHAHLCARTSAEFERRRLKLAQQAKEICKQTRN